MKEYVLHYVTKENDTDLFWRCLAENYNHAKEQLENYLDGFNETLIFCEKYK